MTHVTWLAATHIDIPKPLSESEPKRRNCSAEHYCAFRLISSFRWYKAFDVSPKCILDFKMPCSPGAVTHIMGEIIVGGTYSHSLTSSPELAKMEIYVLKQTVMSSKYCKYFIQMRHGQSRSRSQGPHLFPSQSVTVATPMST
jgi:hypothetical protein